MQIEIPLPDRGAREKIFQIHLRDRPVEAGHDGRLAGRADRRFQRRADRGRLPPRGDGDDCGTGRQPWAHECPQRLKRRPRIVQIRHEYFEAAIQEIGTQANKTSHE